MATDPNASSITVAVRVRPFTIREAAQLQKPEDGTLFLGEGSLAAAPAQRLGQKGLRSVIKVVDDRCLVFDPPEDNPVQKFSRSVVPNGKKVKDQVFAFDRIFDENTAQATVYEGTTKNLLDCVLDGYNATVFAYGATGCGKTHTITGTAQHPGIIFMTMQELFEKIAERSQEKVTEVSLSYLEIYNETIRDLLVPGGSKQGLMLREDSNQAVTVAGLTSHHPKDVQEVMDMIVQGNEYRTVSPTEANAVSSRSHAVLQINVAQKDRNADVREPHTMATLSIIDLAGSERASATKNRGERLMEGANINKSLLALGSCINALCDPRKKNHVPYRNSKLTRLLKFSLGGNCKTVMIVCVSPSSAHFDETQNTLRYANRAKNIQTKVTRNVFNVNRHVKDFLVKIDEQMALINELKAREKNAESIFFAKFQKTMEKRDAAAREGVVRLRQAYENAAAERQEKVANMKRLKALERRIGLLSAWITSFDSVRDARQDEDSMPHNLVAMRKTAQGDLVELENSRHHIHQKLERSNWERAIDTALHHSMSLLPSNGAYSGERDALTREAELLKSGFMRDAYLEVLEQDKAGDSAITQALLTAQFDMIASLSETLKMDEEQAVVHAKSIIHRLLETSYSAASHVIKPDGSLMPVEIFPPTKRGTPKRKKSVSVTMNVKPISAPYFIPAGRPSHSNSATSPTKGSPRRRKAPHPRKGVSFTPVKKSPTRRGVRWRDDETEDGTLADFEKTPKKFESTPEHSSREKTVSSMAPMPSYLNGLASPAESSPSLTLPETATLPAGKPNRFKTGFLSKCSKGAQDLTGGSTFAQKKSIGLMSSSDTDERASPLRSIPVSMANTLSPPVYKTRVPSLSSPRSNSSLNSSATPVDENNPPSHTPAQPSGSSANASGANSASDSESSFLDGGRLRSALLSVKKRHHRVSSISGTAASKAKQRVSSAGSLSSTSGIRVSSMRISTNGISRRRGSSERRLSPPIACSPPQLGYDVSFSGSGAGRVASAARRPGGHGMRGSMNRSGGSSPVKGPAGAGSGSSRRTTISGQGLAAAPAKMGPHRQGQGMTWR